MYISKILFFLFCIYAPKISTSSIQVETQIGSFNLRTDKITEKKFINEYGKGFVVVDQNSVPKHIFYDDIQKLWISINFSHVLDEKKNSYVESILITSDSLCCKKFEPIKSFDPMLTSKGIKIGDTLLKIIAAYGEPSINIDIANESFFSFLREELKLNKGRVLRYLSTNDELYYAEFFVDENEILQTIYISGSE